MIEIRVANPDDAPAILDIYSYYIDKNVSFEFPVPKVEDYAHYIKKILKKYPYLVVLKDGEIIGYAYASAFRERALYNWSVETTIYFDKDHTHNGYGWILYSKLFEILKLQGFTMAYSCILYPYPISTKFHEKFGFKECGRFLNCAYKNGKWLSVIYMEKQICSVQNNVYYPEPIDFKDLSKEQIKKILSC